MHGNSNIKKSLNVLSSLFFSFSLSQSDLFYLLIVGVENFCCTEWHTHTHTFGGSPLYEGSACRRDNT